MKQEIDTQASKHKADIEAAAADRAAEKIDRMKQETDAQASKHKAEMEAAATRATAQEAASTALAFQQVSLVISSLSSLIWRYRANNENDHKIYYQY